MLHRLITLCTAFLLALAASGCVYIDGERVSGDDWRETQRVNRDVINQLEIGLSRGAVVDRLGTPVDSEAFMHDGDEIRVLFYRTRHRHSDGETSRDETTPLVFRNDRLEGWGLTLYDAVR